MIISIAELIPCNMPKDDPTWAFARATIPVVEGWIVHLRTQDGTRGFGYVSTAAHLGTNPESAKAAFEAFAAHLIDRDPGDLDGILAELERRVTGQRSVKAGIDCALHELKARMEKVPLWQLFGEQVRSSVPVIRTMAIKSPADMAAQAQRLVDDGYTYLKIKIHGDVDDDLACVRAIREQVSESVHLTVDANQSYTPENAIVALNKMADLGVELAEQPISVDDHAGLKRVTEAVPIIVEADEGANSLDAVRHLVSNRIVNAISLKIPQLGGLRNTMAAAKICEAAGIQYRMGGAVGPRLLTAQGMHLCATFPSLGYACEFGEFVRLLGDPTMGIEIRDGLMTLPDGIGSGIRLPSIDGDDGDRP